LFFKEFSVFKRVVLALVLAALALGLSGCGTIHGFGEDMQWTGEQIEAGAGNFTSK
jgi:predicted small secreted protein